MMDTDDVYIGMDLGGTTFKALGVTADGDILGRRQGMTAANREANAVIQRMTEAIQHLRTELETSGYRVAAIGIGIPGILDLPGGVVRRSPNLPFFRNIDLQAAFGAAFDVPVCIENDANAALLGEVWLGAGRDMRHGLMLTLGTGVGGAILVSGELLHGTAGYAGEIGHTAVEPDGPLCGCGSYGCLEQFASGTAIARMAAPHYGKVTAEEVAQAAQRGETAAVEIYQHVGRALGIACASFANLLNPERIILGGAVAQAFDLFIAAMQRTMQARAFSEVHDCVRVVEAACGPDAGGLGAAYRAMLHVRV